MFVRLTFAFATLFLLSAGIASAEEAVSTKAGSVYLGEVTELTDSSVSLKLQSPEAGTRQIPLEDLADTTLWRLRSKRIAADDGKAMLDLGKWAEARGLLVAAAYEYRRAAELESVSVDAKPRLATVVGRLALELFERAEGLLAQESLKEAQAIFKSITERYPQSAPARAARKRVALVESLLKTPQDPANNAANVQSTPRPEAWTRTVKALEERLEKAARYEKKAAREKRPVRQVDTLKKAVAQLEAAWAMANKFTDPPEDVPPEEARAVTTRVRQRLIAAYLDMGLSYLLRGSHNQAQEYCAKVEELDPRCEERYALHGRIIEARLGSTFGASAYGHGGRASGAAR